MDRNGIVASIIVLFLIGLGLIAESLVQPASQSSAAVESIVFNEIKGLIDDLAATPAEEAESLSQEPEADVVEVVRVVDGDTIVVEGTDGRETVRLIGVDTPESVHPSEPVECFGTESSAFLKELLPPGSVVELEADPSQGEHDRYGRRLAYVFLPGETNVNKTIIEEGFGHEYTYQTPYKYQLEFQQSEKRAREQARGLWSSETCN